MSERDLEPGTWILERAIALWNLELTGDDVQPLQAHLRASPQKSLPLGEAVQPNARQAGIRLRTIKAAEPQNCKTK